jgi:hypothetical protein
MLNKTNSLYSWKAFKDIFLQTKALYQQKKLVNMIKQINIWMSET